MPVYKIDLTPILEDPAPKRLRHPKCKGWYDEWTGEFDCDYYTTLTCDECKYGDGRKDPEAKCNQI